MNIRVAVVAMLSALLLASVARAQTSPGLIPGQIVTDGTAVERILLA